MRCAGKSHIDKVRVRVSTASHHGYVVRGGRCTHITKSVENRSIAWQEQGNENVQMKS